MKGLPGAVFIFFFVFLISPSLQAQSRKSSIDSVNSIPYEFIVSNTRRSIRIFTGNIAAADSIGYSEGKAKALSNLGLAQYIGGNYDKSTESYLKAIDIYEGLGDYKSLAELYGEYGYQLKRRDMKKASQYMLTGISIARKEKTGELILAKLLDNYGVLKEMQSDPDSAMYYYRKALSIKKERKDTLGIPYSLNKIAGLKILQKKFSGAFEYLRESDGYRLKEKGDYGRAENLSLYADLYAARRITDSAIAYYEKCLSVSKKLGYKFLIQYSYRNLTDLYKKKNEFGKALENFTNYVTYKDSVSNYETNSLIAQLEIDYETARKDKLIAENEHEIEQKNQQIYLALLSLALISLASVWIYKYQKQKSEKEKRELELRSRLAHAELENELSNEKLRISRELHDNIGSRLTFVISTLDNLVFWEKHTPASDKLRRLNSFARETLSDLRNTIWAIKTEGGDTQRLKTKLRELIMKTGSEMTGVSITLINNSVKKYQLSSARMLNIYRIIQEAVQNSLKHSGAKSIRIEFGDCGDGFSVSVKDDGRGFDAGSITEGSGLNNMKQRCAESGGNYFVETGSSGTKVECIFKTN